MMQRSKADSNAAVHGISWGKMPFDHNIIRYMHTNEVPAPVFQWQAFSYTLKQILCLCTPDTNIRCEYIIFHAMHRECVQK